MDNQEDFKNWLEEEDFIKNVSIDCVIFGFYNGDLKVLLPKLKLEEDLWALPGGFVHKKEGVMEATNRIIEERIGLVNTHIEQIGIFGDANRESNALAEKMLAALDIIIDKNSWLFDRFISMGFCSLIDYTKAKPKINEDIDESCEWHSITQLPKLAIDHAEIIQKGLEMIKMMLEYKLIGFHLLTEEFTMQELQKLYETILGKPLRRDNFQRKMHDMEILERLEKKYTGAQNKAPYLYRFKGK